MQSTRKNESLEAGHSEEFQDCNDAQDMQKANAKTTPAKGSLNTAGTAAKRDTNAKQTQPQASSGAIIEDDAFKGIEISGDDTVVENFPGFDISSVRAINTSAYSGGKITGGRVTNYSGPSSYAPGSRA